MPVELPYEFDTSDTVVAIVRGFIALLLVIAAGVLYSLLISRSVATAAALLLSAAILVYAARGLRILRAARGTITSDTVTVRPVWVHGIRLPGPQGMFQLREFTGVRVEPIPPPDEASGGTHARVSLVGQPPTPDILIARRDIDEGRELGRQLATLVKLPCEEVAAPY